MTTLAEMKLEIEAEMDRSDLADASETVAANSAIHNAIMKAIRKWQRKKFWFNQANQLTFQTVPGQAKYQDEARFYDISEAFSVDLQGQRHCLRLMDIARFEHLTDNSASQGRPYAFTRHNDAMGLYPIPNAAYGILLIGYERLDAPATDTEPGNAWMLHGYDLILLAAKANLYVDYMEDAGQAGIMAQRADDEARELRAAGADKSSLDRIVPTQW
jgi:hypothetical protein